MTLRLKDQTRRIDILNFPKLDAFHQAQKLLARLIKDLPIDYNNDDLKDGLFIIPGPYNKINHDTYLYSAIAILSFIIIITRDLYRKHDISFDDNGFSDDDLAGLMPATKFLSMKGIDYDIDGLENFCLSLAEKFVEAIETQFYFMKDYDCLRTNHKLMRYMESRICKIKYYAGLGLSVASILNGYNLPVEAGELASTMKKLKEPHGLLDALKREDHFIYFGYVLLLHARLKGLFFNDNVFAFTDLIGDEITAVANWANLINDNCTIFSDFFVSSQDNRFSSFSESGEFAQEIRENLEKNWLETLCEYTENDDNFLINLALSKEPFYGLEDRLHAFGLPYQTAKFVSDYLLINIDDRSLSCFSENIGFKSDEIYKELYCRGKYFIFALRHFIKQIIGKEPNQVIFKHFYKEDETNLISAIGSTTDVSCFNGKEIENILDRSSKLESKDELQAAQSQYGVKGLDIRVGVNNGVCCLLDYDQSGYAIVPKFSIIETRESSTDIAQHDRVGAKLFDLFVAMHEMIHAAQVNTKLIWRETAYSYGHYYAELALKELKLDRLDVEIPYQRIKKLVVGGMTWRELILEYLDVIMAQALGEGPIANDMRTMGVFDSLMKRGISIKEGERVDIEELRRKVKIEESQTARDLFSIRTAIADNDTSLLNRLVKILKKTSDELRGITETMANTFALIAIKEFIQQLPDRRYGKASKDRYYQSLYSGVVRDGQLAEKFLNIAAKAESSRQTQAELKKVGLKYQQVIGTALIAEKLMELGYDPLDPFAAYEDMDELALRAKQGGLKVKDLLYPYNSAVAAVGIRYNLHIPLFMEVIEKYGVRRAFRKLLNVESLAEIKRLLL